MIELTASGRDNSASGGPQLERMSEMKTSLLRRIEQLEKNPRWQPPAPPTEQDRLFWKLQEQLLSKIDDKYARLVRADLPKRTKLWSELTWAFVNRVTDHLSQGTPLAFPSAVAEVHLENPKAGESATCQQCHYGLPRSYFKFCPLCNGAVY
jgi:hypothetical protein